MLYVKHYDPDPETIQIDGFEVPIPLPVRPPRSQMMNYGKPEAEQRWERLVVPPDLEGWDMHKKAAFIEGEWHKRRNGVWVLINGNEIYVPGMAYFFLNYWFMVSGRYPDFRMEAIEYFLVTEYVIQNKNAFGKIVVKPRQLGETEKELCIGYDLATRHRDSWFGMQNTVDDKAYFNFKRVTKAHRHMPFFFKPMNTGNDDPENELVLKRQAERASAKTLGQPTEQGLESRIDFRPTKQSEYDGVKLRYYHLDEFGKIEPSRMDITKQWGIIKPTLSLYNDKVIVGKASLTSTVEEMAGGRSIELSRELWEGSDPSHLDANGRTSTGLFRYFRSYLCAADTDEYGFHKKEHARQWRQNTIAEYRRRGDMKGLGHFLRKQPETVEEALMEPAEACILFPEVLENQMSLVREAMAGRPGAKVFSCLAVRGDLVWEKGFGGSVRWVPNPVGKFEISQHPDRPNLRIPVDGKWKPGNTGVFSMGCDSIDHTKPVQGGSDGAFVVFRAFDPMVDSLQNNPMLVMTDEGEILNTEVMLTDRFVLTYRNRPDNPRVFYEDALKCAIYYGVQMFAENDKPGILHYFEDMGFLSYLAFKVKRLTDSQQHGRAPGASSRGQLIEAHTAKLQTHVATRSGTYVHLVQLQDYRNFTGANRQKCDLVVASGFALGHADNIERVRARAGDESRWEKARVFKTYSTAHG